jgi:hypothetical protein
MRATTAAAAMIIAASTRFLGPLPVVLLVVAVVLS